MQNPTEQSEIEGELAETDDETTRVRDLAKDDIFHLLQNRRRRDALRYLEGEDEEVRMRDLAEQVAAWEHDTTVQALTSDERQRVYIALYQSHLPKLDDEGVIEYNQSRGIVERTAVADQLSPYLDADEDDEETAEEPEGSNAPYYSGALGLSTLVVGSAAAGLALPTMLAVTVVGLVALTLFTMVTNGVLA
ncbi:hypothetical protein EGH23_12895 [Halomicroarcula sp. F27]|uniref:DUF7344 domain-containing protein n=2 Tax=Haloarcula nitratireducens TaxID=2487749 RepID=A0AAW4PED4_9EURY|nr:hypothetical protein [Halomicroarcula nitratireducens]